MSLMNNLERVIKGPEQTSALFWQTASEIMLENQELLEIKTSVDGEERFLVTPECRPLQGPSYTNYYERGNYTRFGRFNTEPVHVSDESHEKDVLSHSFSIAAQTNSKGRYKPGMPLYLIVDGQVTSPILQFDRMTSRLVVLDGGFGSIDDSDETIGKILGYIEEDLTNRRLSNESKSAPRRRRVAMATTAILGLSAIGGGIFGFVEWREYLAEQNAENIQEFDNRNIVLDSTSVKAGEVAFTNTVSQDLMNEIPFLDAEEGYDLESPRKIIIEDGECETITVIEDGSEVRAVSGITEDLTTIAVTNTGQLFACSLELDTDSTSDTADEYEIAVQILKQS